TFCVHSCASADECPTGYACPDLNAGTGTALNLCWPNCFMNSDCHTGQTCMNTMGGACAGTTEECYCSDARPAPDGGPPPADAGAADAGASDAGTASLCGNGTIDGTEQCDGTMLGTGTCVTEGFTTGTLACLSDCTYDTMGCM